MVIYTNFDNLIGSDNVAITLYYIYKDVLKLTTLLDKFAYNF